MPRHMKEWTCGQLQLRSSSSKVPQSQLIYLCIGSIIFADMIMWGIFLLPRIMKYEARSLEGSWCDHSHVFMSGSVRFFNSYNL